ncbi:MAG: hypothetical protein WDZ69_03055 [Candidatus Pacearchaeota archaeon]
MIKIKNKRGDMPITIFVIGVLAVCGLVIFSFYLSTSDVAEGLKLTELVSASVVEKEKISLYRELGFSEEEIDEISPIEVDGAGRRHIHIEGEGIVVRYILSD